MQTTIHYLLIAKHLTGDSKVYFFREYDMAKQSYDNQIKPLLDCCKANELEEDEAYYKVDDNGYRFYAGIHETLDELINESDTFIMLGKEVINHSDDYNINSYLAEFVEHVDDSTIQFFNENDVITKYNEIVDSTLEANNDRRTHQVIRTNNTTWDSKTHGTLFSENEEHNEAYFGCTDITFTYRMGVIEYMNTVLSNQFINN